jgi:hypothetical protein
MYEIVPAFGHVRNIDGLTVKKSEVVVAVANREAHGEIRAVWIITATPVVVGRYVKHARHRRLSRQANARVGVVAVSEAEAGLLVGSDHCAVRWSNQLVAHEPKEVPVPVIFGLHEPKLSHAGVELRRSI